MSVCPNKECRSLNTKNLQTRNRSGKPNPINKNKANIPYTKRYRVCLDCAKEIVKQAGWEHIQYKNMQYPELARQPIKEGVTNA